MASKRKRIGNEKAKAKRKRSWEKNQAEKQIRIADQQKREQKNRELGTTGKQRANLAAKAAKRIDTELTQEDLLEQ